MKKFVIAAAAVCISAPAIAQQDQVCGPYETVKQSLAKEYGETRQTIGLDTRGGLVIWWGSADGTWTLTITAPGGVTCLVANGQAFQNIAEELMPSGDPA